MILPSWWWNYVTYCINKLQKIKKNDVNLENVEKPSERMIDRDFKYNINSVQPKSFYLQHWSKPVIDQKSSFLIHSNLHLQKPLPFSRFLQEKLHLMLGPTLLQWPLCDQMHQSCSRVQVLKVPLQWNDNQRSVECVPNDEAWALDFADWWWLEAEKIKRIQESCSFCVKKLVWVWGI